MASVNVPPVDGNGGGVGAAMVLSAAEEDDAFSPVMKFRRFCKRSIKLSMILPPPLGAGNAGVSNGSDLVADFNCFFLPKLRISASRGLPPSSSSSPPPPPPRGSGLPMDGWDSSVLEDGGRGGGRGGAGGGGGPGAGGGAEVATDVRGIIAGISTGGGTGAK